MPHSGEHVSYDKLHNDTGRRAASAGPAATPVPTLTKQATYVNVRCLRKEGPSVIQQNPSLGLINAAFGIRLTQTVNEHIQQVLVIY